MKKSILLLLCIAAILCGCSNRSPSAQVAATTLPVYNFTSRLCEGTPITVSRLVTEQVSCLHDYSLNVRQVKSVEAADLIILSGAGLEEFMEDLLDGRCCVDASEGIPLLCGEEEHSEGHGHNSAHSHEHDPHIWLSPANAIIMARNICDGLARQYPACKPLFEENLLRLEEDLSQLQQYGENALSGLPCRDIITFHDGFQYFAQAFGLNILEAVEEESGSEASAAELIRLITLVREHSLPAVFTEVSGSVSAAGVISRETGCRSFPLDMAMAGDSYFDAMYRNIDTVKEALQ